MSKDEEIRIVIQPWHIFKEYGETDDNLSDKLMLTLAVVALGELTDKSEVEVWEGLRALAAASVESIEVHYEKG